MSEPIPLSRPAIGPAEEELVLEVLRSGRLSLGPMLGRFEEALGGFVGADHVSAVSSGTAGLHLATRAAGVQAGDEVITSPFSFVASANCLLYEDAKPVFADVDPVTLNVDPAAVEAAVTERTAGLLPVHIFGLAADMAALERIAEKAGLWIVEDACEAIGASYSDGGLVGARGHRAVFAFYPNKQLTTGEGGAVVCVDAQDKARIDSERNQGRAPNMDWLDHDRLGFNYRMSDIGAALGLAQAERLATLLDQRAAAAALYNDALANLELTLPSDAPRSWFVYVVQVPAGVDRDDVIVKLGQQGIATKPYLPAIHLMSFYKERFGWREGQFPVCEDISARSLALPFFGGITESQVSRVAEALAQLLPS
ncbi:MAG: perosamine synthetase [Thermoleophilaceae bacterium]|nr:perosamine synthetase [Thermoleophilaceae bacterium]